MTHTTRKQIKIAYKKWYNIISRFDHKTLTDAYDRPSFNKVKAYKYCTDLKYEYKGNNLTVIGYNCHIFTVGFEGIINNRLAFFYITPSKDEYIYLDEIN